MKHKIIKATLSDLDELVGISRRTFIETFGEFNTQENMQLYFQNDMSEGNLKAELEDNDASFFLLQENNTTVAYLKINYNSSQAELEDNSVIELERIYILRSHQKKGLGKMLLQKAIDIAKKINCDYLWLAVWEHNSNAIEFYKRQRFGIFGSKQFYLGKDIQKDICMKLELKANGY